MRNNEDKCNQTFNRCQLYQKPIVNVHQRLDLPYSIRI